jgi:cytoskeletal protein RodZ
VKRRGPDIFGMMLIGGLGAFIVMVIIFIATQTGSSGSTTTATSSNPAAAATGLAASQNPPTDATQQARQYATATAKEPHITAAEAVSLAATKSPTIIDVRETTRYQAGHVRGARNVPYNEAQTRLSEFPKLGDLILYCQ